MTSGATQVDFYLMTRLNILTCFFTLFFRFTVLSGANSDTADGLSLCKRCLDLDGDGLHNYGEKRVSSPRLVKRKIVFATPPPIQSLKYFVDNPPDLFSAMTSDMYLLTLPRPFVDFIRIFCASWYAYQVDFKLRHPPDLEMLKWSNSPIVEALPFETHLAFLDQILKNHPYNFNETSSVWDLVEEYICYTFSRPDMTDLSEDTFISLILSSIRLFNTEIFDIILERSPETLSSNCLNIIWQTLTVEAKSKSVLLSLTGSYKDFILLKMFHKLSIRYGPIVETALIRGPLTVIMNNLLIFQPLLSAVARHDSESFLAHSGHLNMKSFIGRYEITQMFHWIDLFLKLDKDFIFPKEEQHVNLGIFADSVYDFIISIYQDFALILLAFLDNNFFFLAQFLLMYSPKARSAIPTKLEQCKLLVKLVELHEFDFDYQKIITIFIGFDLKLSDIDEYLLPQVKEGRRGTVIIKGLQIIMEIVESFPSDFTPETVWILPKTPTILSVDTEGFYLLDAGRILLARHFKIVPASTTVSFSCSEEACYRDLVWFMAFFVNLYRPDLGPEFKIKIDLQLEY